MSEPTQLLYINSKEIFNMADYKIVLLKGDGIGPEIVNQAVKV